MKIKLKELLFREGLSLNEFARQEEKNYSVLWQHYAGKATRIDLSLLQFLMKRFKISRINDIFDLDRSWKKKKRSAKKEKLMTMSGGRKAGPTE